MIRILKIVLAVLLLGGTFGAAQAQSETWTVSEVSGRVILRTDGNAGAIARGAAVEPGSGIGPAAGARAVIVRGKDVVTLSPNSRIRIPAAQTQEAGLSDLLQEWGNANVKIETRPQ